MPKTDESRDFQDVALETVLEGLLERNEDITARAAARLHPSLKAASSITRSPARRELLAKYQSKQTEIRRWIVRKSKLSNTETVEALAARDQRIVELEQQVAILTASHVAILRAVGELGGMSKWKSFFESYAQLDILN